MVDIVIVNWNSGEYLSKCINSILSQGNEEYVNKIFIIDNNSSDQSYKVIATDPKIISIENPDNKGFAKACNQGFSLCTANYTLLLNPDAQLQEDTLFDCISFMKLQNEIDILGCALVDDNGSLTPSCARFPTPLRYFYDATGLSKIAPFIFTPAILMTDWDHKCNRKVDQVMGAFMFMPTTIFFKYGYFDERYFVYYEELDFSKKIAEVGGTTFYNKNIKVVHSGGGSTNDVKAFRLFLNLNSRLKYAKKHFSLTGYLLVWICTFLVEPITRSSLLLLQGNFREIKEVFKGYQLLIKLK